MNSHKNMLPGFNHAPASLGRVLILGLGKSGMAAAQYCAALIGSRVESLTIAAGAKNSEACAFAKQMEQAGARAFFEYETFNETYDVCIASPGISQMSDFYQNAVAACTEVISEIEFAWRECPSECTWIAITGTNGKTTTTSLIAHILQQANYSALPVGNIGDVCLQAVSERKAQYYVVEVSSYQLASTRYFAPRVAVLLNITPDHLSWHRTHENYIEAKLKVFANLAHVKNACAVIDATDDTARSVVRNFKATSDEQRGFSYIPIGTQAGLNQSMIERCGSQNAAYVDNGLLVVEYKGLKQVLVAADELQIKGSHNISNALCAASSLVSLGLSAEEIAEGLRSFAALKHRIEPCGSVNGVDFYNDSKATNVDATLKAFSAFEPGRSIVLLGGRDKGTSLDELVKAARKQSSSVICFGEAKERFMEAFGMQVPPNCALAVYSEPTMHDAFCLACELAQPGQVVLLSPACASFDEFSCFEERGETFKQYVLDYAQTQSMQK